MFDYNDPVKLLRKAISRIDKKYIIYNEELGNYNSASILQVERSFAYEFYHQLSILLKKHIKNDEIQVSAEIVKKNGPKSMNFPDIIIHKGQVTCDNQFLVGEIKRKIGDNNR